VLGAYLLDLAPTTESRLGSLVKSAASTGGLGGGAIGAGLFLRFGPYPTRLVFVILTALFALLVLAVPCCRRLPTGCRARSPRSGHSWPVSGAARRAFVAVTLWVPKITSTQVK
jgi:hypothetical protein